MSRWLTFKLCTIFLNVFFFEFKWLENSIYKVSWKSLANWRSNGRNAEKWLKATITTISTTIIYDALHNSWYNVTLVCEVTYSSSRSGNIIILREAWFCCFQYDGSCMLCWVPDWKLWLQQRWWLGRTLLQQRWWFVGTLWLLMTVITLVCHYEVSEVYKLSTYLTGRN